MSGHKYDVFLSFRGPDTRRTVADVLYRSLVDAGFTVFRDNEELPVGGIIGPELKRAIDDSRIHLPIFSQGYASSAWCLQELAHMVKRWRESAGHEIGESPAHSAGDQHEIMPVFYGVSPSDVRLKRGSYSDDLLWHEGGYGEETVREWREALKAVADLKGWDARHFGLGELSKALVRELSIKLKKRQKVLPHHLVGIDDRVEDVLQLLDCGSPDIRFLTVHGMGGIGKTTLAKAIYNKIATRFDGCSFLSDVRESSQTGGIVRLQNQLLSDILRRSTDVHNVDDGVNMIQTGFRNKSVLIVLDGVEEREQLMELMGKRDWLGQGSRIIVTTRNVGILAEIKMGQHDDVPLKQYHDYEMTEMDHCCALQLFSKHAFGENLPPDDLETISSEIVATVGGIPLALEVGGSFLRGKSPKIWGETLERLRKVSDRKVQQTFRISYEALSFEEKQIFLDIACFLNNEERTRATYFWEGCGRFPETGLTTLTEMSLLKIDQHNILRMHNLISDFGREIARKKNDPNPGSQSRLWESEECLRLLHEPIDYQQKSNIESLRLQFPEVKTLTNQEFSLLPKLRFLHVEGVNFTGDYKNTLRKLRWLSWDGCPSDFNATNFSPSNLAVLKLSRSELTDDWAGWQLTKNATELKALDLIDCKKLKKLPDLSALSKLEMLTVRGCPSLVEIESISELRTLKYLEILACNNLPVGGTIVGPVGLHLPRLIGNLKSLTRLKVERIGISELPDSIGELKDLESLCLSGCYELRKLPGSIGGLESLVELDLSYTKVTELPESIGNLRKLKVISVDHSEISKIPETIGTVEKLEEFHAEYCVNLGGDIPSEIGSLSFLKILNFSHTAIQSVPKTIIQLPNLQELHLEGCHELKRIPKLPPSLVNLYVESRSLKAVPNLSNLTNLVNLIVSDCSDEYLSDPWNADSIETPELKWVGRLSKLETLKLVHKSIVAPPTELASLPGLVQLVLSCLDLQSLTQPLPATLSMLKLVNFNSLAGLSRRSDLKNLSTLELCKSWLIEIPLNRFGQLENLRKLVVSNCIFLVRLTCLSGLKKLKVLRLLNCPKLVEIQGVVELESLESITIDQCGCLAGLPYLWKLNKLRTMEFVLCRSLVSVPSLSQVALEDCHLVVDRCDKLPTHCGPRRLYKDKRKCPNPRSRL